MSGDKKLRVSSKQRLDLVKKAYYEFLTSEKGRDDHTRFVDDVEEALKNKLDPKDKVK
jgi:hypothetical protein